MKAEVVKVKEEEPEPLPDLFGKLGDDLTQLFDAKLSLLKIELREEVTTYVRGLVMIALGAVVALVGFALLNIAIAFLVSTLFANTGFSPPARYALGFVITAVVYLAIGGALMIFSKNRMAEQDLVPRRTVSELKRDKELLEDEI